MLYPQLRWRAKVNAIKQLQLEKEREEEVILTVLEADIYLKSSLCDYLYDGNKSKFDFKDDYLLKKLYEKTKDNHNLHT